MDFLASRKTSESAPSAQSFRAELLALLLAAQNLDSGWPFHASSESRIEPTCWALFAALDATSAPSEKISAAVHFLASAQLKDGSWPASPGMGGGWVTSLACSLLARFPENQSAVAAGLQWLCDDYPRDSSSWQRFLRKFQSQKHLVSQSDEFRGWGWTPRTSSWVEPTSFALMAFAAAPPSVSAQLQNAMQEREALATGLLYDRMCPGGGWNCGNPRVYGVDGEALVLPTCFALLALQNAREHPNRTRSLQWLRSVYPKIQSAGSLAMASVALHCYGAQLSEAKRKLTDWSASELAEQGTHVGAWVLLALDGERAWPRLTRKGAEEAAK